MIKKLGLSKYIEKDIHLKKKIYLKKNIKFNEILGHIYKVQNVMVNVTKINEELRKDNSLDIFFAIELKVVFLDVDDSRVKVLSEVIYQTETIIIEEKILRHGLKPGEIFIEDIKVSNEGLNNITIALIGEVVINILELDNLSFVSWLKSGEENIFTFDKNLKKLNQLTFFVDNKIKDAKSYDDDITFINNNELYKITENKLGTFDFDHINEYVYLEWIKDNDFLLGILEGAYVSIYKYRSPFLDFITRDIIEFIRPIFIRERNELYYFKLDNTEVQLVGLNLDEGIEHSILNLEGSIKDFKYKNNHFYFLQEVEFRQVILVFDDSFRHVETINFPGFLGKASEIKVSSDNEIIIVKVKGDNLILYNVKSKGFRDLTRHKEEVTISSFEIDDLGKFLYVSDNSFRDFNIYKINIDTLEKIEFIELSADKIEFI